MGNRTPSWTKSYDRSGWAEAMHGRATEERPRWDLLGAMAGTEGVVPHRLAGGEQGSDCVALSPATLEARLFRFRVRWDKSSGFRGNVRSAGWVS